MKCEFLVMVTRLILLCMCTVLVACSDEPDESDYDFQLESGFLSCDGYPTAVESDEYCQDTRPDSWREFRFNGESYFFVPLASL